ncbi:WD repeat-containing protein 1-like [Ptychodera flava]|uniref:WD repeat-containing protein 1-like n=1 Tax=Ptychodera flava TaxID=63121 RepID=UPI003969CBD5
MCISVSQSDTTTSFHTERVHVQCLYPSCSLPALCFKTMSHSLKGVYATLPRTVRGRAIVIGGDPKGKNFLYTNGNSVVIRDIENPSLADVYTEHSVQATVAQYAPSGFYIASGDTSGKIRIWDTTQKEHILKYEYQPLGGEVKDIAWSPDSKRIAVVGEGREKFGAVLMWDTGTSVGSIIGHSKAINSVDYKATRPYRIVTAAEDNEVNFYEGPPFKFKTSNREHGRFVNCVRYSPNGERFATGGADGKSFIYDGKTSEKIAELGGGGAKGAHAFGIYGICWSADSTQLLTVSADKTAKIWDVEQNQIVTEFVLGSEVCDQQVGCLWQGDYLLSVSLSGNINYLDKNNPTTPLRIVKGHNKPITAMTLTEDRSTFYTGASDGLINYWNPESGVAEPVQGKQHTNQVNGISSGSDIEVTVGMDDTMRVIDEANKQYNNSVGLDSQPQGVASGKDGLAVVACLSAVVVFRNGQKVFTQPEKYEPSAVAIHPGQTQVAVGAKEGNQIKIYKLEGDTLQESQKLDCRGAVTQLAYSSDGAHLAASDTGRHVHVFNTSDYKPLEVGGSYHAARVNCIAWAPDNIHLVSGSLDTNIIVWNIEDADTRLKIKGAHPMSQITSVGWLDDNTVISTGQDSCVKLWTITY